MTSPQPLPLPVLPIGAPPDYSYEPGDMVGVPSQWRYPQFPLLTAPGLPLTPEWWVSRLHRRLTSRQPMLWFYDDYYRGEHPLPWLPEQARVEFRRVLRMSRTNYMGLVVDAKAERLQVEGFRVASGDGGRSVLPDDSDDELWRVWQANNLDSESDQAMLEALICGTSYMLVAPNPDDDTTPLVTVEHAAQVILEYMPGTGRRQVAAGLKVWVDDWTGDLLATLYLPDALYKVRAETGKSGTTAGPIWVPRTDGAEVGIPNPLGIVPIVEMANNPRMLSGGRSLLTDLTDIQDRINKTVADRLITQDFGAFPQKWAAGWPAEDTDGTTIPEIQVGRDRMITTEVSKTDVAFGQFDAAPLDPYSAAKREDIMDIAARSRTPAQDLLVTMNNVNGDTLKASQAGHVAVVRQMSRHFGEALERAMRMVQQLSGAPVSDAMETVWRNPEYRTEGELADATVKLLAAGVTTQRQAREDMGYSLTQIQRMEAEQATSDPLAALTATLNAQAAPKLPMAPEPPIP